MKRVLTLIAILSVMGCAPKQAVNKAPEKPRWHYEEVNAVINPDLVTSYLNSGWEVHTKLNMDRTVIMKKYW